MPPQEEQRTFYRIQDSLAIEYQTLSPKVYEEERILFRNQSSGSQNLKSKYADFLPNGLDIEQLGVGDAELIRGLLKLIIRLSEKVDLILSHLEKKEDLSIYQKPPQMVTLSASGIGFCTFEHIPAGTYIKLRILLPQSPQILVTTLGKVVRVTTRQSEEVKRYEVGISFLEIHEDDQEAIIKYTFMRQRDMLRSRSKT